MPNRTRVVLLIVMFAVVGADASCPVETGFTTTYYYRVAWHAIGCQPTEIVTGECTLLCDGTYSCWGDNGCGGLVHCRTEPVTCPPCGPDVP
jgi:hypothetical protein